MKGHPLEEDDKDRILKAYSEGMSTQAVSMATGISVGAVFKVIKAYGIARTRSQAHKGIKPSEKSLAALRERNKNRVVSEETRKKISEAKKLCGPGYRKLRQDGYVEVHFPSHPDSNACGCIPEHRLIMEKAIGRRLEKGEVVHHINHIRSDNRIENLQLMTVGEHMSMHMRERHAERRKIKLTQ